GWQQLARGLLPVLRERLLHRCDRRPAHEHVGVAPLVVRLATAAPLVVDAEPAGDPHASVDDEDLAMVAREVVLPRHRTELLHGTTGVFQRRGLPLSEAHAPDRVDDDPACDALARTLGNRGAEPARGLAVGPDEADDVDALLRLLDLRGGRVEHLAVVHPDDFVSRDEPD